MTIRICKNLFSVFQFPSPAEDGGEIEQFWISEIRLWATATADAKSNEGCANAAHGMVAVMRSSISGSDPRVVHFLVQPADEDEPRLLDVRLLRS